MAHSKKTLGTTPEEIREHARQRLLKYKERLEFELLRVNASLNEGTPENFKHNYRGLWLDKPVDNLVQRKPGATYVKDRKG